MKYFYIHGYGSSPNSETRRLLQQELGQHVVGLSYDYAHPESFVSQIMHLVNPLYKAERITFFASSLGGYVAQRVSFLYPSSIFVLYNPSIKPENTLGKYGVPYEVLESYRTRPLPEYKADSVSRVVVLSTDDEVIDYKVADDFFKDSARIVYTKGGHRMTLENAKLLVAEAKFSENQILP